MSAKAVSISAVFTDLPDVMSGRDLWQVRYQLQGGTLLVNQGFSIFFDSGIFDSSSLTLTHSPMQGWSTFLVPYQNFPPADAFLDAEATVNTPQTSQTFDLNFIWLGGKALRPGSQEIDFYQIDPLSGNFTDLGSSQTQPSYAVPDSSNVLNLCFVLTLGFMIFRAVRLHPFTKTG